MGIGTAKVRMATKEEAAAAIAVAAARAAAAVLRAESMSPKRVLQ